jgi:alpha-amylase
MKSAGGTTTLGVILNANYRFVKNGQRQVMPAPVDKDTPGAPWWWDKVASMAPEIKKCGFSAVQLPPFCKTQSGAAPNADGYGKFDDYDLGNKNQFYSIPTRFGTVEQLRRCIAILNACGLGAYADLVIHQYDGGDNGTYKYLGADGKTRNGRFPKHPSCFVGAPPRVPVDPVFDSEGNFAFGDMVSFTNSTPRDYMASQTIEAADWLLRTTGLVNPALHGFRLDDTKGTNVTFSKRLVTSKTMGTLFSYGECFTGNPAELERWEGLMNGRSATLDFTLHWALQNMCDNPGANMQQMNGTGLAAVDPFHAVTFVDNPDTDTSNGQQIITNKLLAYAYILTTEGYPMVYFRDYAEEPHCYGLKRWIDNLVWIHENLAFGTTLNRYIDNQAIVLERQGYPGLLTAISTDPYSKTISCPTNFGPHVQLHDYTGRHPDIWTDGAGNATFTVPGDYFGGGESYLCFSRTGYGQSFSLNRYTTTQTFFGADDLDIPAAGGGRIVRAGRIWCQANTPIQLDSPNAYIAVKVLDDARSQLPLTKGRAQTRGSGWYTLEVTSPLPTPAPFELTVTYTSTQGLELAN